FAARDTHEAAIGRRAKDVGVKTSNSSSPCVNKTKFSNVITLLLDRWEYPHLFSHIKTTTPEINYIATGAKVRGFFNERYVETIGGKPVSKRWTGNADAGDQN